MKTGNFGNWKKYNRQYRDYNSQGIVPDGMMLVPVNRNNNVHQFTKKTGAKFKRAKNNKPVVVAWKAGRYGLLSIFVAPTKHSKETTSHDGKGRTWLSGVSVSIVNKTTGQTSFHFGIMDLQTGKTIVKSLGWVINPNAPNGGVVARIGAK